MQPRVISKEIRDKKFAIVSFPGEDENLFIVSTQWLLQDSLNGYICLWPPCISQTRVKELVIKNAKPDSTWIGCRTNIVVKCKTYESAESIRYSILKVSARRSVLLFQHMAKVLDTELKSLSTNDLNTFGPHVSPLLNDVIEQLSVVTDIEEPRTVTFESQTISSNLQNLSTSIRPYEEIEVPFHTNSSPCDFSIPKDYLHLKRYLITKFQRMTCLKELEDRSFEELRSEDSAANLKGDTNSSAQMVLKNCTSAPVSLNDTTTTNNSLFNTSNTNGFTASADSRGLSKFNPIICTFKKGSAETQVNAKLQCITCMEEYKTKSLEELRLEDYTTNHKNCISSYEKLSGTYTTTMSLTHSVDEANTAFEPMFKATNELSPPSAPNYPIKFAPTFDTDIIVKETKYKTKLLSITCMKEFEDKSFEEIRLEDLIANHYCGVVPSAGMGVGTHLCLSPLFTSTQRLY